MKNGVQQMMLGSVCSSEDKTNEVLKKIKAAGYDGIEVNQYMIHPTSLFVRGLTKMAGMPSGNCGKYDWVSLLKNNGLEAISLHTDLDSLEKKPDYVLKDAESFKVKYIVITGMYYYSYHKLEKVVELAERLNRAGKMLMEHGYSLLYHNHNVEMVKVNEEQSAYDILIANTDPQYVNFEVDAYWLSDSGKNPLDVMKKLGDRMKLWHVTDRGVRIKNTPITPIVKYDSVELGTGNLDLDALYEYCQERNIEYCILESHKNWINGSPLDSLLLSSKYLNSKKKV